MEKSNFSFSETNQTSPLELVKEKHSKRIFTKDERERLSLGADIGSQSRENNRGLAEGVFGKKQNSDS